MKIKLADWCHVSKTRRNEYQRCIACEERLYEGSVAISITKPNPKQCINNINVWIHVRCAPKYFRKILRNVKKKGDEIMAYEV